MIGRVLKSTGSWYEVVGENQTRYPCRIRGKMRLEGVKESNPIAVGDQVEFDEQEGVINQVLPRQNHVLRQSVKKTGHASVLAANLDQVLIMATLKHPRTSTGFIDRVLVSAESFRIPQIIVVNKHDLLDAEDLKELASMKKTYEDIGIPVLSISAQEDPDVQSIASILDGKVTLIAGHSGVGKSTLLNRLSPAIKQTTGSISGYTEKGTHTTTFAEMFPLNPTTFIIDTPGIKEWGLVDMEPQEVSDYFPEMRDLRLNCKFGARCLHLTEPRCAVLAAVEQGVVAPSRYQSYLKIVTGEDNRK